MSSAAIYNIYSLPLRAFQSHAAGIGFENGVIAHEPGIFYETVGNLQRIRLTIIIKILIDIVALSGNVNKSVRVFPAIQDIISGTAEDDASTLLSYSFTVETIFRRLTIFIHF